MSEKLLIKMEYSKTKITILSIPIILLSYAVQRTLFNGDYMCTIIPYALLFTPSPLFTKQIWRMCDPRTRQIEGERAQAVKEIQAKDYSYEYLVEVSEGLQEPVVVRGLFADSNAVKRWHDPAYLNSSLKDYEVPITQDGESWLPSQDVEVGSFGDAYTDITLGDHSNKILFFPLFNRKMDGTYNKELEYKVRDIIKADLQAPETLGPIWQEAVKMPDGENRFQFIIAQGWESLNETTGTPFHCAAGGNWFVQTVGTKVWYFVHPKYTSGFEPLRHGPISFAPKETDNAHFDQFMDILPNLQVTLQPGDLLYNPPWYWHAIRNGPGTSLAAIMRSFDLKPARKNNFLFTLVMVSNKIWERFGVEVKGFVYGNLDKEEEAKSA